VIVASGVAIDDLPPVRNTATLSSFNYCRQINHTFEQVCCCVLYHDQIPHDTGDDHRSIEEKSNEPTNQKTPAKRKSQKGV